jgi:hypothetical protein
MGVVGPRFFVGFAVVVVLASISRFVDLADCFWFVAGLGK